MYVHTACSVWSCFFNDAVKGETSTHVYPVKATGAIMQVTFMVGVKPILPTVFCCTNTSSRVSLDECFATVTQIAVCSFTSRMAAFTVHAHVTCIFPTCVYCIVKDAVSHFQHTVNRVHAIHIVCVLVRSLWQEEDYSFLVQWLFVSYPPMRGWIVMQAHLSILGNFGSVCVRPKYLIREVTLCLCQRYFYSHLYTSSWNSRHCP